MTTSSIKIVLKEILGENVDEEYLHRVHKYTCGIPGWLCIIASKALQRTRYEPDATMDDVANSFVHSYDANLLTILQKYHNEIDIMFIGLLRWCVDSTEIQYKAFAERDRGALDAVNCVHKLSQVPG